MNFFEKKSLRIVDQQLKKISTGHLRILLPTTAEKSYGEVQQQATVMEVGSYKLFTRLVATGDIGLGEAWLENEWVSDDLIGVLELFQRNRPLKTCKGYPYGVIGLLQYEMQHMFGRHHAPKSPCNQMGYELSDEFYEKFLDEKTMLFSSALFESLEDRLAEAQLRTINRIIELSDIKAEHHVLEIGCGRAGFIIELARQVGCRITGTTIAEEEYRYARARIDQEGLSDLVSIELCEYDEIPGSFDRIIAIDSLETIGRIDFGSFYATCNRLLKPDGQIVQQVITVSDQSYEASHQNPTWLQQHVFPGGMMPSITELSKAISRHSSFNIASIESIGHHYGETLRRWLMEFQANKKELVKMGYDGIFQRKWCYFLSYCQAAFQTGAMNNHHIVLTRSGNDPS